MLRGSLKQAPAFPFSHTRKAKRSLAKSVSIGNDFIAMEVEKNNLKQLKDRMWITPFPFLLDLKNHTLLDCGPCENAIQNNGFLFSESLLLVILREYHISEGCFYFFPSDKDSLSDYQMLIWYP